MSFLSRAKTKSQRLWNSVKVFGTSISAGFHEIVGDVVAFCSDENKAAAIRERQHKAEEANRKWVERGAELKTKDRFEAKHSYAEKPDHALSTNVNEYLSSRYAGSAREKIKNMSPKERCDEVRTVASELGDIYGVDVKTVNIFIPNSEEVRYAGYYCREDCSVNINMSQIFSEDPAVLVDIISTINHEFYHARQWNAVNGIADYGYSAARLAEWTDNFLHYYGPEFGPLYFYQPLETSARGIENAIKDELK